ncbi:solute carrier family 13 member 2-like [Branchiostoma lanceolatum]|uniref:solute carrier family 13 member 2-like n=1 Tax=Branchiostoma lanceolatum TaxID=7740 RepID=UPI00345434AB
MSPNVCVKTTSNVTYGRQVIDFRSLDQWYDIHTTVFQSLATEGRPKTNFRNMANRKSRICKELLRFWKTIVLLVTPVIFSPLPIYFASTENSKVAACGYVVIIMAVYWSTEALPLAVTGLLPLVLFPMLGIQSARDVSINYAKDPIFLLIGSLLFAITIEKWNLHKRIALGVLVTVGVEPKRLMFGMMSATAFLSMWISNTATTAMMIPTAENIISGFSSDVEADHQEKHVQLKKPVHLDEKTGLLSTRTSVRGPYRRPEDLMRMDEHDDIEDTHEDEERPSDLSRKQADRMAKGLLLCTCYAANIGGIATVTGSSTNIMAVEIIEALFPKSHGIDFATWFFFGFPTMILILILAYFYLLWLFVDCGCLLGCRKGDRCKGLCQRSENSAAYEIIKKQYNELGPLSFAERVVIFHFVLLVLMWVFRDMKFVDDKNGRAAGWTYFFVPGYVTDASTVILVIISLFFWPSRPPSFMCCRDSGGTYPCEPAPPILDWSTVSEKMSWGLVFLLGGGYALADGIKVSGLSTLLGKMFKSASGFPPVALVLTVTTLVSFLTELVSNAPVAAIILPILAYLAEGICMHPYYLLVPATIASSFAFMLPVANPPNAIVLQSDRIQVYDMIRSGFLLNLLGVLTLNFAINTYGIPLYDLDTLPSWGKGFCNGNVTTFASSSSTLLNSTIVPVV